MTALKDLVLGRCVSGLSRQQLDGSMPAGTNGAYGDVDTPVRNTSHWLYLFCFAYKVTKQEEFRNAALSALEYILACGKACAGGIVMRHAPRKDATNGILGPAHVVEALLKAAEVFGRADVREFAIAYLERHSYNDGLGCWNSLAPNGDTLHPDMTFNHQLYFAAVAALGAGDSAVVRKRVEKFISGMSVSLGIRPSGRIQHMLQTQKSGKDSWKESLKKIVRLAKSHDDDGREKRYHLYNLYGFSLLRLSGYDIAGRLSQKWLSIIDFTESTPFQQFVKSIESRTGSLGSGTETIVLDYAFYRTVFQGDQPSVHSERVTNFLVKTSSPGDSCSLFSPDPETQRARCYRYVRFLERVDAFSS